MKFMCLNFWIIQVIQTSKTKYRRNLTQMYGIGIVMSCRLSGHVFTSDSMFWAHQYKEINMHPSYYTWVVNLTVLQLSDNFCLVFQARVISCPQFVRWVRESLNLHHLSCIHALLSLEILPTKSLLKNFGEEFYKVITIAASIEWCQAIDTLKKEETMATLMWFPRSSIPPNFILYG